MNSGYELPDPQDHAQTDHAGGAPPWLNVEPYRTSPRSGAGR